MLRTETVNMSVAPPMKASHPRNRRTRLKASHPRNRRARLFVRGGCSMFSRA
jgi:hypothetical protein